MSPRTRKHCEDWSALRAYLLKRRGDLMELDQSTGHTSEFHFAIRQRLDELAAVSWQMSKIISRHKRRPQQKGSR